MNTTHIRVRKEEKDYFKQLARDLSSTQNEDVKIPEVVRRMINIPRLKDVLINDAVEKKKKISMNKRGAVTDIFIFMATALIIIVILGAFLYMFREVNTAFSQINVQIGDTTFANISSATMGKLTSASDSGLKLISICLIFGMIILILGTNYFVKVHPVFFIIYIGITIISVIVAVPISNSYEQILSNQNAFTSTLTEFSFLNYLLLHLPYIVAVIGIIGSVFIIINFERDTGI